MTKLVLVITRIFFKSFWNFPGIFFWWIILRQVRWWVLQLVKYAHTVEPLWKGQESLTKVAKLGPFPGTIIYKSCLFYPSWQATSWAFIEGFHCNWPKSAHWHFLNPWSHFLPRPVLASGYSHILGLCHSVCINHLLLRTITRHLFKLGSINLVQRSKTTWLRSLLFWGAIDLDLQSQI